MRHLRSILSVVATTQLLATPHGITAESSTRGGTGDAFPYVIRQQPATRAFDSTRDYFAVDAVSWFANRQGNWRQSEQASGTVKIKAGPTDFSFPLGAFQLEKGAVTSPIFNIPVVPTTPFDGSPISISASIVGLRKNTALGAVLRDIANAAVTYGTTALNTMALTSYPGLPEVSATATN